MYPYQYTNLRNTAKLAIVTLSAAKPRGSMRVVQRSSACHVERVCDTKSVAANRQRNISCWYFMSSGFFSCGALRRKFSEGSRFGREILRWNLAATRIELFTRSE